MAKKKYWLMKSEPNAYSIGDLKRDKATPWDGIRNYQARNFMRDEMSLGDEVLFYHSNSKPPGVVGLAVVSNLAQPDVTALDPKSDYFDSKSTPEKPIWVCVSLKYKKAFPEILSLADIKSHKELKSMLVAQKGQRLSIQPVEEKHFRQVCELASS